MASPFCPSEINFQPLKFSYTETNIAEPTTAGFIAREYLLSFILKIKDKRSMVELLEK